MRRIIITVASIVVVIGISILGQMFIDHENEHHRELARVKNDTKVSLASYKATRAALVSLAGEMLIHETDPARLSFYRRLKAILDRDDNHYYNTITEEPTAENCDCMSCHGGYNERRL